MKTILKKSSAALMAAALMATSAVSAYAADSTAADNNTATTNDLNNSDIIDSSKKGSITIHKYDITSATKDGVYTEGERKATGQTDSTLESTMADYEVEGVEFTYLRCGNVETFSANLNGVRDIKLAYEVPEALCTILGLDSADSIDMTEASVAFKCGNTGLYHYTSQQINPPFSVELDNDTKKSVKHDFMFGEKKNSENLFVERWYQLLRENGRLAAVLPESVFDTTENKYIRLFLYKYFTIKAVVSLPQISFEPYTSTKTSILFAQKKTAAEVKAWNDAWDSASEEYSHLVTQTKNLIAVANGTKQKAKLPSIKNLTAEQEREVLARMLKNYLTELDDELDASTLINKYSEELEDLCTIDKDTKDTFGFVNTWWVFGEVASKLDYAVFMAEADNIGYKRTKRGERPMSNDLYRTGLSGDILIDDGVETTILDAMRKIDWN